MWKILFLFLFCLSTSARIIVIERDSQTVIKDLTNLNGLPVRIMYFELEGIRQGDSETKITRPYGDIWTLLGEYLNFTLVPIKLDKKQYPKFDEFTVLRELLAEQKSDVVPSVSGVDNRIDFTLQFYTRKVQLYARPVMKNNEKWLFSLVEYKIWLVIGALLLLMAIVGWISDRFLVGKISRFSMGDQLFYNLSTLCIQDTQPNTFKNRFHVLTIVRCVLVFMFWGYFGTFLYAQLTVEIDDEQFRNVEELLKETDVKILVVPRVIRTGPLQWTLDHPVYKERIELVSKLKETFDKTCAVNDGKYAMITTNNYYEMYKSQCEVRKRGEDIFNIHVSGAVRKGFPYKRSIDKGILKLKESGLLDRIHNHWYPSVPKNQPSILDSEIEPFDLNQFKYVFGIWALGMILCFLVLVGEIIVWRYRDQDMENIKLI